MTGSRLPSLRGLRAFEAVARLGSMTLAAGELAVTPAAISRQIKELELDLGIPVVERHGRGLRLTGEGSNLQESLNSAFSMIHQGVERTRRHPRRKRLLIRTPPVFADCWLMPRFCKFRRRAPKVDSVLVCGLRGEPHKSETDVTIAIEWGTFDNENRRRAVRLTREQIFPACVPEVCPNASIAGATLVHRHDFAPFPDWPAFMIATGLNSAAKLHLQPGVWVSGGMIMNAARRGMGIALLNTTVAKADLEAGRLVRPIPEAMDSEHSYWMLIPEGMADLPEVREFEEWMLEESEDQALA